MKLNINKIGDFGILTIVENKFSGLEYKIKSIQFDTGTSMIYFLLNRMDTVGTIGIIRVYYYQLKEDYNLI